MSVFDELEERSRERRKQALLSPKGDYHQQRRHMWTTMWLLGHSYSSIARTEGLSTTAISNSVSRSLSASPEGRRRINASIDTPYLAAMLAIAFKEVYPITVEENAAPHLAAATIWYRTKQLMETKP